jgi:hypothetical protein
MEYYMITYAAPSYYTEAPKYVCSHLLTAPIFQVLLCSQLLHRGSRYNSTKTVEYYTEEAKYFSAPIYTTTTEAAKYYAAPTC